jgi:hypothetical protein
MTMTIDELIQSGVDQARHVLIGAPGAELLPAFVIQFKDRPPTIVATPWSGDDEKHATVEAMRAMLKIYRASVHSYMFWSEVWLAHEDPKHPIGLAPRDRQDRKEAVFINAFNHEGGKVCVLEIVRDDKGVVRDLVKNKHGEIDQFSGRLHNLLQED